MGPAATANGVVRIRSAHDVARTVERLVALLAARGLRVFARIDFAADAVAAGLTLRPEQLVIFGNPKSGTPLLAAAPAVGLDLPLKALVFEDADGVAWLAYDDAGYIIDRHGVPVELTKNIEGAAALMIEAATGF
jgi:uncharacterized protein (DUF302 family)